MYFLLYLVSEVFNDVAFASADVMLIEFRELWCEHMFTIEQVMMSEVDGTDVSIQLVVDTQQLIAIYGSPVLHQCGLWQTRMIHMYTSNRHVHTHTQYTYVHE